MPIPCAACGQPVHREVVVCPHCGERTGVPPDPHAVAVASVLEVPKLAGSEAPAAVIGQAMATGAGLVLKAVDALLPDGREARLPKARARIRRDAAGRPLPPSTGRRGRRGK